MVYECEQCHELTYGKGTVKINEHRFIEMRGGDSSSTPYGSYIFVCMGCYKDAAKKPKIELTATYRDNKVYEVHMPDGNSFRYTWGEMVPFGGNSTKKPKVAND